MKVINIRDFSKEKFVEILQRGGLMIFPFDTCYGLVCDPGNQEAVNKLLKYKSNREGKPISVAVSCIEDIGEYVEVNESAKNFVRNFLPGPFTLILKSKNKMAKGIESEKCTLGFRIPNSQTLLEFLEYYKRPVTSTSANQSYKKVPYSLDDIIHESSEESLKLIDVFIDAGKLEYKPPSTVIDMSNENIHIIRKGSIIPDGANFQSIITKSEEETMNFASELMKKFQKELTYRPVIFALQGDMGAGKTHFTKGLAKELGVEKEIQSPTFIIISEYLLKAKNKLFHIDTWRLEESEIEKEETLDISKLLERQNDSDCYNIISIEWADKILHKIQKQNINAKIIWIEIQIDYNSDTRIINWTE